MDYVDSGHLRRAIAAWTLRKDGENLDTQQTLSRQAGHARRVKKDKYGQMVMRDGQHSIPALQSTDIAILAAADMHFVFPFPFVHEGDFDQRILQRLQRSAGKGVGECRYGEIHQQGRTSGNVTVFHRRLVGGDGDLRR